MSSSILRLQPLTHENDIQRVVALEAASYPADEAASDANIRYRQQHAGAFFSVAFVDQELVGFVNGTLTASQELEEESMSKHDPKGSTLCIHSVVIDAAHRRKGLATAMLKQYVHDIIDRQVCPSKQPIDRSPTLLTWLAFSGCKPTARDQHQVTHMALIAKAHLVKLYVKCGFTVTRLSPVVHGNDPWFELILDCTAARRLPFVQVDAFTSEISQGNPAAVLLMLPSAFYNANASEWMQRIAIENNLSETAYMAKRITSSTESSSLENVVDYDLRWFSPECEVDLCGHGTLSAAHLLYHDGHVDPSKTIHFHTLSGVLVCNHETVVSATGQVKKLIQMEFPLGSLLPVRPEISKEQVAASVGISPDSVIAMKQTQTTDVMVHIEASAFPGICPDLQAIAQIEARAVVVTAQMAESPLQEVDFQSRVFGPRVGVSEDPVTGSAHCGLASYWCELSGKNTMVGKQSTPVRGGYVSVELLDARPNRVLLKGEAVISLRGFMETAP